MRTLHEFCSAARGGIVERPGVSAQASGVVAGTVRKSERGPASLTRALERGGESRLSTNYPFGAAICKAFIRCGDGDPWVTLDWPPSRRSRAHISHVLNFRKF